MLDASGTYRRGMARDAAGRRGPPNNLENTTLGDDEQPPNPEEFVTMQLFKREGKSKVPVVDGLEAGVKYIASIKLNAGSRQNAINIAAIELIDYGDPMAGTKQLFAFVADCIKTPTVPDCHLYPQGLPESEALDADLLPMPDLNPTSTYVIRLRYAAGAVSSRDGLLETSATDPSGEPITFSVAGQDTGSSLPTNAPPGAENTAKSTLSGAGGLAKSTFSAADIPASTSTTSTTPTTPPTSPDVINGPDTAAAATPGGGLSTGAKAGIGVGVAVGVLLLIAALVALWVRRTRRGRGREVGEKEGVLAAAAPRGEEGYRDAEDGGMGVGSSAGVGAAAGVGAGVARKPVGSTGGADVLSSSVPVASGVVGVPGEQTVRGAGETTMSAEERERWEEEERRLDEDIAEAERRRLGS